MIYKYINMLFVTKAAKYAVLRVCYKGGQFLTLGKSVEELEKLQGQIEAKLSQHTEGLDIGYWESLISQVWMF